VLPKPLYLPLYRAPLTLLYSAGYANFWEGYSFFFPDELHTPHSTKTLFMPAHTRSYSVCVLFIPPQKTTTTHTPHTCPYQPHGGYCLQHIPDSCQREAVPTLSLTTTHPYSSQSIVTNTRSLSSARPHCSQSPGPFITPLSTPTCFPHQTTRRSGTVPTG
jgi:hypothetical protein